MSEPFEVLLGTFMGGSRMETIYECCAGLDVHKKTVVACVRRVVPRGRVAKETRSFGTMTRDLLALSDWMMSQGVTHVAMESTGVFWKPIYNLLEGRFEVLLCNARHIKQVPGRKTDVKDCQWIAELLQHGLLTASFVPPRPQRDLRDLCRHRAQVVSEKTRVANRVHKVLEDANIKLGSVASDVLGASGRAMIRALIGGERDPAALAELARRRLRGKIPQLRTALEGRIREHHRFMLETLFDHLEYLEEVIDRLGKRIEALLDAAEPANPEQGEGPLAFGGAAGLLTTVPGIDRRGAENILAEIGTDMSRFGSCDRLSSWAGVCPGNNQSAQKQKSGRTTKGNRWLRRALSQAAWAAAHTKNTYLSAQYRRLAARRGKKRAVVAVSHTLLVIIYHLLNRGVPYEDLGPDHFNRIDPVGLRKYLVKRLESLGYSVAIEDKEAAA